MNLRKDHSHVSNQLIVNELLWFAGWWLILYLGPCVETHGLQGSCHCLSSGPSVKCFVECMWTILVPSAVFVICVFYHNFQRLMSRLEQRWRAQRSVISIVNCRIPWTNRDLNVYCALGISLKACLLQSLFWFIPAHCIVCVSVFYCVSWCSLPLTHVIHGAWSPDWHIEEHCGYHMLCFWWVGTVFWELDNTL